MSSKTRGLVIRWRVAIRDSELDRTAKLVAFVLSTYMNASGEAFPSKARLAAGASLGSGKRAVDNAINRIEEAGLLLINRASDGKSSNTYRAIPPHGDAGAPRIYVPPTPARIDSDPRTNGQLPPHPGAHEVGFEIENEVGNDKHLSRTTEPTCFICDDSYKAVDEANGNRPHLVGHAGQWFCEAHYLEQVA